MQVIAGILLIATPFGVPLIVSGAATIAGTALTPTPPRQKQLRDSPTYGIDRFDNPRGPEAHVPILYGAHTVKPVVIAESVTEAIQGVSPGDIRNTRRQEFRWLGIVAEGEIADITKICTTRSVFAAPCGSAPAGSCETIVTVRDVKRLAFTTRRKTRPVFGNASPPAAPHAASQAEGDLARPSRDSAPQVTVESAPSLRPARTASPTTSVTHEQRESEARRRGQGLREVLDNIQGEPVYVEGVDGPRRK